MVRAFTSRTYNTQSFTSRTLPSPPRNFNTVYVNSVQYGSITIAAGNTVGQTLITEVKNIPWLNILGFTTSNDLDNFAESCPRLSFTDATTITATRNTTDAVFSVTVNFCIIDATENLIKQVHYGSITTGALASGTAKIPVVDTTKSAIFFLGGTGTTTATPSLARISSVTLTDSSTVTRDSSLASSSTTNFIVVEFQPGVIQSIQQFSSAQTSLDLSTTTNVTISAVTLANTFIAYGSRHAGSDNTYTIELTSTTNVRLVRVDGTGVTRTTRYTVIEFVSGILKSNQFVNIALTSLTSNTATISAVNVAKTAGFWSGYNSNTSDTAGRTLFLGITLTNSTTVTGTVDTSSANIKRIAGQFIEFY